MYIEQTLSFKKNVKKLYSNQKEDLDNAIKKLLSNPLAGEEKRGDLAGVRVHKFKMQKNLTLLAYIYDNSQETITLLKLSSHENFYRDLKNEQK